MSKVVLTPIDNLRNENSVVSAFNTNMDRIRLAVENTLSRDGTTPNEMNADLDMNNQRIYNLPKPVEPTEAVRLQEFTDFTNRLDGAVLQAEDAALAAKQFAKNAGDSAAATEASEINIGKLWLGQKTAFPTLDNEGAALQDGALVWITNQADPNDNGAYTWTGGQWNSISVVPSAFEREQSFFPVAGTTTISVFDGYNPSLVRVYRNGALMKKGTNLGVGDAFDDVDASNGSTLVFPAGVIGKDDWIYIVDREGYTVAGAGSAINTTFTPTGSIAANNVQAAIVEVAVDANAAIVAGDSADVPNSRLSAMSARSVKVNATNASARPTDLATTTDGHVLCATSTTLVWSLIGTSNISDGAVTVAKTSGFGTIATQAANNVNITGGTISVGGASTFTGGLLQSYVTSGTAASFDYGGANTSGAGIGINRSSGDGWAIGFYRAGSTCGSISLNAGPVTAYNTTSDYRLKFNETEIDLNEAKANVLALRPRLYEFKTNPGLVHQGFFAHEVQAVVPGAVTGTKDQRGPDPQWTGGGSAPEIDIMQQLDVSKLIPTLTAGLQWALKKIEELENRLNEQG